MITVVIGHRGTGKTSLMQRIQLHLRDEDVEFKDLDDEIESRTGQSIRDLFLQNGEKYFREIERQVFFEALQKYKKETYVVAGAGFDVSLIPANVRVLWLRRRTDLDGRIFLNRPRLEPGLSPLEEYHLRAGAREKRFQEVATEVYLMPEGSFENKYQALATEKALLTHQLKDIGGGLTILPEHIKNAFTWDLWKKRFVGHGVDFFEVRDDLLSMEQIVQIFTELTSEKILLSLRKLDLISFWQSAEAQKWISAANAIDGALEIASATEYLSFLPASKLILSLHETHGKTFSEIFTGLEHLRNQGVHLKLSPLATSFQDIAQLLQWQQEDPEGRSVLPRSHDGRWTWVRLLTKNRQRIQFWKEGQGSALDQPSLFEWMMVKPFTRFAAVLGDPIAHSFTPIEHSDFFAKKSAPVFAIRISREEWSEALPLLRQWGLSWAAVTAPHKEAAAVLCAHKELKAVNTLFYSEREQRWIGASTDEEGFIELTEGIGMLAPRQEDIAVWGGGGTLEVLRKVLPRAHFFSSRTGVERASLHPAPELFNPAVVVWAAPRTPETQWPSADWKPAMVVDLNYKEDSMGREYSQVCGANYESGLRMFLRQAQGQRFFWNHCEENI